MPLVITHTFVGGPGNKAKATQVNQNFADVAAKFTEAVGGISDADCASNMDLNSSTKLSQTPGKQVPTAAIADEAISDAKLAFDTGSPGSDSGRAVSGDHIKTLTAASLARILPSVGPGIGSDKLKLTLHVVAFSFSVTGTGVTTGEKVAITETIINPGTAFPTATYELLGMYVRNPGAAGTVIMMVPFSKPSGANHGGGLRVLTHEFLAKTLDGDLIYVFTQKA